MLLTELDDDELPNELPIELLTLEFDDEEILAAELLEDIGVELAENCELELIDAIELLKDEKLLDEVVELELENEF